MGGDGGSIPDRSDLVKTRKNAEVTDSKIRDRQIYSYCCLSKEALREPIVSDRLGKLYNKESVISYLLSPTTYGSDGHLIASHLRTLKDVTTLHLTPNPTLISQSIAETESSSHIGTQESRPTSLFICPISLKEMNGSVRFVYRIPTGSVISEASLKEIRKQSANYKLDPVTGILDSEKAVDEEWITINPKGDEAEAMTLLWEGRVAKEKEEKRLTKLSKTSSKRKSIDPDAIPKPKKIKSTTPIAPLPSTSILIPSLSKKLAEKLAEDKKKFSPAVAALYEPKGGDANHDADGRSNWMTRGAFTRYA